MQPAWMVYFSVASVDAAAEQVKALGGSIVVQKTAIPYTGFIAASPIPPEPIPISLN
jgi:predicted enzyme related to lactoylglutathione lyase